MWAPVSIRPDRGAGVVRCSVSVGESEPQFVELGGYLVGGAYEEARQGGRVGAADGEDPAGVVAAFHFDGP
jgi:hypothetical protein